VTAVHVTHQRSGRYINLLDNFSAANVGWGAAWGTVSVEIECAKCGRHGRLRTTRLLAEHGPDIKLPDLLGVIAQCPKWDNMNEGCEACYSPSSRIDGPVHIARM